MSFALEKLNESDRIRIAEALFEVRSRSESKGELRGLCPLHGETEPSFGYNYRKDAYWCFACGAKGDLPALYMAKSGNTFSAFCSEFGITGSGVGSESKKHRAPRPPWAKQSGGLPSRPAEHVVETSSVADLALWRKRALALVQHAEAELPKNERALKWLRTRGIGKKTAARYRLGLVGERYRQREYWGLAPETKKDGLPKKLWIPEGIVIPLLEQDAAAEPIVRRIRIRRFADSGSKYIVLPGPPASCMALGLPNRAAVVVENWLDAIMVHSRAGEFCAVVGTGSATAHPDAELADKLKACAVILVALDFGDEKGAGTKGWQWWRDSFPSAARRWPVPVGKDAGEAFERGIDIAQWVKAGLPQGWFLGPYPIGLVSGGEKATEEKPAAEDHEREAVNPVYGKAATTEGVSAHTADEQAVTERGGKIGAAAPTITALDELAGLLREHPVEIRVATDGSRIWIRENQSWKRRNWETARRISNLVFMDREVLVYLQNHGAEIINGTNIMEPVV